MVSILTIVATLAQMVTKSSK